MLDTNVLVREIEGADGAALDSALAGRAPLVAPQAAREFLVKGDPAALQEILSARGGSITAEADPQAVAALQAPAACMVPIMTGDTQVLGFLRAIQYAAERF